MTENKIFRVLDTGVLEGRLNIAIGQAIIESRQAGRVPDTLRFLRFPPTALVGRHQALGQEVDLDYCRRKDIGVVRRITGGGAIFMEPGLLGWELAFDRKTLGVSSLPELTRAICEAAAEGISSLGVTASYRPRNDIEVDGRKVSGTGGFFDGDTLIYQGTVLVDVDPARMMSALKVPQAKLARHGAASAAQRIVSLRELLGDATPSMPALQEALLEGFASRLGLAWRAAEIDPEEEALARRLHDEEIGTDGFVEEITEPADATAFLSGSHACPGGTVTAFVRLEGRPGNRLGQVLFTGDFFVAPPRVVFDLESSLKGLAPAEAVPAVEAFFRGRELAALSVTPADFRAALQAALADGAKTGAAT